MIGKLTGRIDYRADDHILLDVKGVGYLVYCSERTLMAKSGRIFKSTRTDGHRR